MDGAGAMDSLIAVAVFSTHIEADLARSALEAGGIESTTAADDAGGQRPHLAFSQGVAVLVREEDAAAARELLGVVEAGPAGPTDGSDLTSDSSDE